MTIPELHAVFARLERRLVESRVWFVFVLRHEGLDTHPLRGWVLLHRRP